MNELIEPPLTYGAVGEQTYKISKSNAPFYAAGLLALIATGGILAYTFLTDEKKQEVHGDNFPHVVYR